MAKWGFGLGQVRIRSIAEDYLKEIGHERKLGEKWFRGFMTRQADRLSLRNGTNLSNNRAQALSQTCVDDFFKLLKKELDEHDLHDKPFSIWNCDESGYSGNLQASKIVCHSGEYNPVKLTGWCDIISN